MQNIKEINQKSSVTPIQVNQIDNQFELQKKCSENDGPAMNIHLHQNIFFEPQGSFPDLQEDFLEGLFDVESFNPQNHLPLDQSQSPQFESFFGVNLNHKDSTHSGPATEIFPQKQKKVFKSSISKNVCYNICQKTIKVIKKGTFEQKLQQICTQNEIQIARFKQKLIRKKKQFTGPKALSSYLEQKNTQTKTFAAFMKWFLTQKYLRMAINEGEMKNLKIYIEFKNFEILPLLE